MNKHYSWIKHLDFIIVDLISLFLSFIISYRLKFSNFEFYKNDAWIAYIIIVIIISILVTLFTNPYSGVLRRSYYNEIIKSLKLSIYNFAITSLIFFSFKIGALYSRELSFLMYVLYFVLSVLLKYIWKKVLVNWFAKINTVESLFVVGDKTNIKTIIDNIMAGDFQLYDIKGIHLINSDVDQIDDIPVIQEDYIEYILNNNINKVLIAISPGLIDDFTYKRLYDNGIELSFLIESIIKEQTENQYLQNFGIYNSLSVSNFSFSPSQKFYFTVKRIFDITFGLLGIIVLLPVSLLIKISYLLSNDKARIIYSHKRIGLNGKPFSIYKFRTMVPNADNILKELLKDEKYKKEWDENQKFEEDPRITKVGNFLRKTSIDELPQLINVLKGDMSLVGPRPLIEGELEKHNGLKLYQK